MTKTHNKITKIKIKTENIKINVSSKLKAVLKTVLTEKKKNWKKNILWKM